MAKRKKNDESKPGPLDQLIDTMIQWLEKAPPFATKKQLREQMEELRRFVAKARPARLMMLGRRGAGKSSLINAIFDRKVAEVGAVKSQTGNATWYRYRNDRGSLDVLDTRGFGDHSMPPGARFPTSVQELLAESKKECPDAILFLCKAKEVDARITDDIKALRTIQAAILEHHSYAVPVVGVVTQVDELDPSRVNKPPFDHPTKQKNIECAVECLRAAFAAEGIELTEVVPISAVAEFEEELITYKAFWNIDKLVEYLCNILPQSAQVQFARVARVRKVQSELARKLVALTALICAGIAATPIPVADILPITAAQTTMIVGIGAIAGRELSAGSVKEFATAAGLNIGAAMGIRELARALIKFIPVFGDFISAGVAWSGTWLIGMTAIAYFIEELPMEEAKRRGNDPKNLPPPPPGTGNH